MTDLLSDLLGRNVLDSEICAMVCMNPTENWDAESGAYSIQFLSHQDKTVKMPKDGAAALVKDMADRPVHFTTMEEAVLYMGENFGRWVLVPWEQIPKEVQDAPSVFLSTAEKIDEE